MTPEEWEELRKRIEAWDAWRQKKIAEERQRIEDAKERINWRDTPPRIDRQL